VDLFNHAREPAEEWLRRLDYHRINPVPGDWSERHFGLQDGALWRILSK
jgi:hypothetical protein